MVSPESSLPSRAKCGSASHLCLTQLCSSVRSVPGVSCCTFHKQGRNDSTPHVPWLGGFLQEPSVITTGLVLLSKEAAPSLSSSSSIGDLTQLCPLRNLEQVRDLDGRRDIDFVDKLHTPPGEQRSDWFPPRGPGLIPSSVSFEHLY